MKAYTDIEQSKKLTEILPLKSADMSYDWFVIGKEYSSIPQYRKFIDNELPCWSLAALLDYLRNIELFPSMETDEDGVVMYISCYNADGIYTIDTKAADFVDAYYDMIVKLHEQHII